MQHLFGIFLCALLSGVALISDDLIPLGAVTIAILVGAVVRALFNPGSSFDSGISFCEKKLLAIAIALMGVNLDFQILHTLGLQTVLHLALCLVTTLAASLVLAAFLRLNWRSALLIGVGNGICGSSAIAATESLLHVPRKNAAIAIAVINLLGTIGMFIVPLVATLLLHLSDIQAGVVIGSTLQAVGHVVAAGYSLGEAAGQTATLVKMARILFLLPVILTLLTINFFHRPAPTASENKQPQRPVPAFIFGFILCSLIPTLQLLPASSISLLGLLSNLCLIVAMAAIGLRIELASIAVQGRKFFLLASILFAIQIVVSCIVASVLYQSENSQG